MIYALINSGIVTNVIVIDQEEDANLFTSFNEAVIRIDNLDPMPGIGWEYVNDAFVVPPPEG